jgi:hypothetical protein
MIIIYNIITVLILIFLIYLYSKNKYSEYYYLEDPDNFIISNPESKWDSYKYDRIKQRREKSQIR